MSQVTIELATQEDLDLLLTLLHRMKIHVLEVKGSIEVNETSVNMSKKMELMHLAANDPLFQADVEEVITDFQFADADGN